MSAHRDRTLAPWFGDGSDGSIIYSVANARWEDAAGAALATVSGKWTVSSTTLTIVGTCYFRNITANGGTLLFGGDGAQQWPTIMVSRTMRLASAATARAWLCGGVYWRFREDDGRRGQQQ